MAKDGITNDSAETPAEARRRRLADSLRANLRRRKARDRRRAEPEKAAETDEPDGATD